MGSGPTCVQDPSAVLQLRTPLFVHTLEKSQLNSFFRRASPFFRSGGGGEIGKPYYEMNGLRRARGAALP